MNWDTDRISEFYSQNEVGEWNKVLGSDLHYHFGQMGGLDSVDIFQNAVRSLYRFIPDYSKVLDCGCGWGGPARLISEEKKAEVTAITNCPSQAKYLHSNKMVSRVIEEDLHQVELHDQYDIAMFIESYCHLHEPGSALINIGGHAQAIVMRVLYSRTNESVYDFDWMMRFPVKRELEKELSQAGFDMITFEDVMDICAKPSAIAWDAALSHLNQANQHSKHFHLLHILSQNILNNYARFIQDFGLAIVYAEKRHK